MAIRWEKFTVKAQEAVKRANDLASEHGNPELLPIHLLAALLRANAIPAGFCYQRLKNHSDVGPAYYLHGLNAVWLEEYGWYRADARGNRTGVNAAFTPPDEQLAFVPTEPGEADLAGIFSDPLPEVVHLLSTSTDYLDVRRNLTDPGE